MKSQISPVRVTLLVTLPDDDSRYLVIEAPLPAMFEAVNSRFSSQNTALGLVTSEHDRRSNQGSGQ